MAELMLCQPMFPGESGIDQLVEIIKVLGTPTKEQLLAMNPNYTEHRFPQIKPHPFSKVRKNGPFVWRELGEEKRRRQMHMSSLLTKFPAADIQVTNASRGHRVSRSTSSVCPRKAIISHWCACTPIFWWTSESRLPPAEWKTFTTSVWLFKTW